jgi:hypothetical protein
MAREQPKRGRRRRVALQRRDLAILELLVVRRAETLDELHRRYFDGLSRKRVLNRLGELTTAGYLHRESVDLLDSPAPQSVLDHSTGRAQGRLQTLSGSAAGMTSPWVSQGRLPARMSSNVSASMRSPIRSPYSARSVSLSRTSR